MQEQCLLEPFMGHVPLLLAPLVPAARYQPVHSDGFLAKSL